MNEYPNFVFTGNADPRFVERIKKEVEGFSFDSLPSFHQQSFREMRQHGYSWAFERIRLAMAYLRAKGQNSTPESQLADILWHLELGQRIVASIPETERRLYLPFNDVRFLYEDDYITVQFRSLQRFYSNKICNKSKWCYYSNLRPMVEVDGNQYIVAFSSHAIERLGDRINPFWLTYGGCGDVFAYLEECTFFDPCALLNTTNAFTFFELCAIERSWHYDYVRQVLGVEQLDPANGTPYYRVGYCPFLVDGDFAIGTTLLFPGFSKTPEYGKLMSSGLAEHEKRQLAETAKKQDAKYLIETRDFSAIKWFHHNGVPQVLQSHGVLYNMFREHHPSRQAELEALRQLNWYPR